MGHATEVLPCSHASRGGGNYEGGNDIHLLPLPRTLLQKAHRGNSTFFWSL